MPELKRQNASVLSWPLDPHENFLYMYLDPEKLAEQVQMNVYNLSWFFFVHKDLLKAFPAYCSYYSNWMAVIDFYVREFGNKMDSALFSLRCGSILVQN